MTLYEYFREYEEIELPHNNCRAVCRYCIDSFRSRGEFFPTIDGFRIDIEEAEENGLRCEYCEETNDLYIAI